METILKVLLKIVDYFLMHKESEDPKKTLCQNLVKLYLLVKEFIELLEQLRNSIQDELKPLLMFYEDEHVIYVGRKFSPRDVATISNHVKRKAGEIKPSHHPLVQKVADYYNDLNHIRDQIFDLTVKAIPLERLGVLFPEFERDVTYMMLLDTPYVQVGGPPSWKAIDRIPAIRQLNEMKSPLHGPMMSAVGWADDKEFLRYCTQLSDTHDALNKIRDTIKDFIISNCTISDIL